MATAVTVPAMTVATGAVETPQDQRPDHVELFLDAERPQVEQRFFRAGRRKVAGVLKQPEVHIAQRRERPSAGFSRALAVFGTQEDLCSNDGQQSPRPSGLARCA